MFSRIVNLYFKRNTALFTAIFAFFTKLFLEVSKCLACKVFDEMLAYVIFFLRKKFFSESVYYHLSSLCIARDFKVNYTYPLMFQIQ